MTLVREMAARLLGTWVDGFRRRRGLVGPAAVAPPSFDRAPGERLLLHVGCGHAHKEHIACGFAGSDWREIRLDADPAVAPDILATMVDLSALGDASVDAVFSSHGIEHLYWHDVPLALAEFRRVLAGDGFLVVTCPDLQAAAEWIAEDRVFETAYMSAAGAITPFDLVYSFRPFVEENPQWMSHHCGFTLTTLKSVLRDAGFASVFGFRRQGGFDLWVLASKSARPDDAMRAMATEYLPLAR